PGRFARPSRRRRYDDPAHHPRARTGGAPCDPGDRASRGPDRARRRTRRRPRRASRRRLAPRPPRRGTPITRPHPRSGVTMTLEILRYGFMQRALLAALLIGLAAPSV